MCVGHQRNVFVNARQTRHVSQHILFVERQIVMNSRENISFCARNIQFVVWHIFSLKVIFNMVLLGRNGQPQKSRLKPYFNRQKINQFGKSKKLIHKIMIFGRRNLKKLGIILILFCLNQVLIVKNVYSQTVPQPPCTGDNYGTQAQARAIELAMANGSVQSVTATIAEAKNTRGNRVGCAESVYENLTPNFTEPTLAQINTAWEQIFVPQINNFSSVCPAVGRDWAAVALGGYYARLANQTISRLPLAEIGKVFVGSQYSVENASGAAVSHRGIYGYLRVPTNDVCYRGGIVGPSVETFCTQFPHLCVNYDGGIFAGKQFVVADVVPEQQIYDGGIAFDQGFAGVMMIEAAIQQPNRKQILRLPVGERIRLRNLKETFRRSALLAADWAIAEPPVRNHNYTAKLIWLLAVAYNWTGDARYKTAMLDKIERNLKPGILMDLNEDGLVDGMNSVRFDQLTVTAQRPGRNWDAHNALPWYGAKNAWAMTEAYVALRDRGDAAQALALKPYLNAMLANLAWEINNLGVPSVAQTQILHALLLGLWKVAVYENEPRPEWQRAAAAVWNTPSQNSFSGSSAINNGLYRLYKSNTPYRPYLLRE